MSPVKISKPAFVAMMLMLMPISCTTNAPTENNPDVIHTSRIFHSRTPSIPDSEFAIVQTLFRQNNLDPSNLQIYGLLTDQGGYYVRASQFYLGLEFFTNDLAFVFDSFGTLSSMSGGIIGSFPLDTIPKAALHDAGRLYDSLIAADPRYRDSLDTFRSKGFNAELGIYDLNTGKSYDFPDFVLCWKMTVAQSGGWPIGYLRADSLKLVYYNNAVIVD